MTLKRGIISFFIIGILGTLGHFFYEWSGENYFVGLFFPVSESTWEHLKLLFFPSLIFSLFEYRLAEKETKGYLCAVTASIFIGMLSIITLFYTISGVLGRNVDFINISIYYISLIIMLRKKNSILKSNKYSSDICFWICIILITITAILFIVFSYNLPSIGLFAKP